jgi:hypothetical protein
VEAVGGAFRSRSARALLLDLLLAGGGYATAWFWVLAANDRARRMDERRGWTPSADTIRDYLGVRELRHSRPLP